MNPGTFLKNTERITTGLGFKKMADGITLDTLRTSAGLVLTAATAPIRASLETSFEGVQSATSTTDLGSLQIVLPGDYDESNDYLRIRFLAKMSGSTDTPAIDAALYRVRSGGTISGDLDPTISAALSGTLAWIEINCDSQELQAEDALHFDFTSGAHTTDTIDIYAMAVEYKSDLVFFDFDDRN